MAANTSDVIYRTTRVEEHSLLTTRFTPGLGVSQETIHEFANRHEAEKREMQSLNDRLGDHLSRVRALEEENQRLKNFLDELKSQWGFESGQVKDRYDDELVSLRKRIDDLSNEKAHDELASKRAECDALSVKHAINLANQLITMDNDRVLILKQQLESSAGELASLKDRFHDKKQELQRARDDGQRLERSLKDLKDRFDLEAIGRVNVQNQLQTIEEQIAFMKAIHDEERNELISLGALPFDNQQFYRSELSRAINLIKSDFENLARERRKELDDYYENKTEEFIKYVEIQKAQAAEPKLTPVIPTDYSTVHSALIREQDEQELLYKEHNELRSALSDLERELQDEVNKQRYNIEQRENEYADLLNVVQQRQQEINAIVDGNVSLQFEINTYRRLLELEENRLPARPARDHYTQVPTTESRTMTVQKTARGPIGIDQVDPEGNFIVLENTGPNNRDQDLSGWTIRRKTDSNVELVYRFPNNFMLKAQSRLRIFSRDTPQTTSNQRDSLVADNISAWGTGNQQESKLYDSRNVLKAALKQTFL